MQPRLVARCIESGDGGRVSKDFGGGIGAVVKGYSGDVEVGVIMLLPIKISADKRREGRDIGEAAQRFWITRVAADYVET